MNEKLLFDLLINGFAYKNVIMSTIIETILKALVII